MSWCMQATELGHLALALIKRGQPDLSAAVARRLSELLRNTGLPAKEELVIYELAWCLVETGDASAVEALVELLKARGEELKAASQAGGNPRFWADLLSAVLAKLNKLTGESFGPGEWRQWLERGNLIGDN